ncbi:MAG: PP2C family protein-serine/threonine phosphatase [Opitutales bacterium]
MTLHSAALTDIGLVRPENEDSILRDDPERLYAVADGIGGLPSGAQASRAAVDTLDAWIRRRPPGPTVDYKACLTEVNRVVHELGRALSPVYGIGSTLTAAHFLDDSVVVLHVGDSTLFRFRRGELDVLTVEHNLGNEIRQRLARGESVANFHENRSALTRCIGQPPPLAGDITTHPVLRGDRYVFCSDGISRAVLAPELCRLLAETAEPMALCRKLVARANELGGLDNASAVVVYVG